MFGFENLAKEKIINYFAEKYLEKDDKSLIAFFDEKGKAQVKIFKFDIAEKVENLKKDYFACRLENESLKKEIEILKSGRL